MGREHTKIINWKTKKSGTIENPGSWLKLGEFFNFKFKSHAIFSGATENDENDFLFFFDISKHGKVYSRLHFTYY